jgi:hypothetical protein
MIQMIDEFPEHPGPPSSLRYLHTFFCFIYILLLTDIVLLSLHQNSGFPSVPVVDKIAGLFYEPFRGNFELDILEGIWPGPAIIFALASFGLIHFGISKAKPVEPETSLMNRIIIFFRLIFYCCMTLLVILIVIRTAVMTYRDFTEPNRRGVIFGIGPPKK